MVFKNWSRILEKESREKYYLRIQTLKEYQKKKRLDINIDAFKFIKIVRRVRIMNHNH